MGMHTLGKALSASSVHRFMESAEHERLKAACGLLLRLGSSIIPSSFLSLAEEVQLPETGQLLGQEATSQIFRMLATAFCEWALTEDDFRRVENMQTAYNMCFYATYFDAIREDFHIEGAFDVDACLLRLPTRAGIMRSEVEEANTSFVFLSEREIKEEYAKLSQAFKEQFFSIHDIAKLIEEQPEQRICLSENIDRLPESALRKYESLLLSLERKHEAFERWYSFALQNEILNRLSQESLSKEEEARALKKDLYLANPGRYHCLFGDEKCPVEDIFTLSNYRIVNFDESENEEETIVRSIDEIVNLVLEQRFLLIVGPYGSGKTTLLKRLHLECQNSGRCPVYAFNARDLAGLSLKNSYEMFDSFFGSLCAGETVFLIDSLDDLNIPPFEGGSTSLIDYFIGNAAAFMQSHAGASFVVSSRKYARVGDDETTIPSKIFMLLPGDLTDKCAKTVRVTSFKPRDIDAWVSKYPFSNERGLSKREIKDANGDILEPLRNPLFLYVFAKQYDATGEIRTNEGYFYYYERFIDQTIKGKFKDEAPTGAQTVSDYVDEYRKLLQQVALEVLETNAELIHGILAAGSSFEPEPLLPNTLQEFRLAIRIDRFSKTTSNTFNNLRVRETDLANYVNCFFFALVDRTIFFTDANIMFVLASEKIFSELKRAIVKDKFEIEDLDMFNLPDFFHPVVDCIIYKIRQSGEETIERCQTYLRSFVLDVRIRSHFLSSKHLNAAPYKLCARIIMLYILFFKLNGGSLSGDYSTIFEDMAEYADTLNTLNALSQPSASRRSARRYSIERYCMRSQFVEPRFSRINLDGFNFQDSSICNAVFRQCRLSDVNFNRTKMLNEVVFDLCSFEKVRISLISGANGTRILFRDCTICSTELRNQSESQSLCKFTRCFVQYVAIHPTKNNELLFDGCTIETIKFSDTSPASNKIYFKDCLFKTQIDCRKFKGGIYLEGKCAKSFDGSLFANIDGNRVMNYGN